MSYQTGTSTGPNDLLDKLRAFLLADGWTINDFSVVGGGYRLHVQKTASDSTVMYFNFRSAIAETGTTLITENNSGSTDGTVTAGILINGSTGYDGGEVWHKQPGYCFNPLNDKSYAGLMNPMSISAIPAYYFFSVDDTVNIAVECTSGKFQFMSFGLLDKQGAYTGGQFFCASFDSGSPYHVYYAEDGAWYYPRYFTVSVTTLPSGGVYIDADSVADWRINGTESSGSMEIAWPCVAGQTANGVYTSGGMASFFWSKSPNFYNNIAAMCPIYTFLKRSDDNYSLIGWPSGVRFLNVLNYSAGQEIVYGSETWKIFPANDVSGYTGEVTVNANCGFGFKKVT